MPKKTAKPKTLSKPTLEQFEKYQQAYDYFNEKLFKGELKPCLLVFREGRKKANGLVLGHFAFQRWSRGDERCHEISLNPEALNCEFEETAATLVHEMCHQWQYDHGKPPRPGYHDRQFAAQMGRVGLIASNTGAPGGKTTGQQMHHYVERGGPFALAMKKMPKSIRLPWVSGFPMTALRSDPDSGDIEPEEKTRNKVKYSCRACKINVWGRPDLHIICGECDNRFESND